MEHEFDEMHWCVHCGAGRMHLENGDRPECNRGVIAISHIVRTRRIRKVCDELIGQVLEALR